MSEVVEFPTVRYHPAHDPVTVKSHKELQDLGKGWVDSPAGFPVKENPLAALNKILDEPKKKLKKKASKKKADG